MAAAGTTRSRRLVTSRIKPNSVMPCPSAYAHASIGWTAISPSGTSAALTAIAISNHAYALSALGGVRREDARPAKAAPSARPPITAASTVPTAATVWPMWSVRRRDQVTW